MLNSHHSLWSGKITTVHPPTSWGKNFRQERMDVLSRNECIISQHVHYDNSMNEFSFIMVIIHHTTKHHTKQTPHGTIWFRTNARFDKHAQTRCMCLLWNNIDIILMPRQHGRWINGRKTSQHVSQTMTCINMICISCCSHCIQLRWKYRYRMNVAGTIWQLMHRFIKKTPA